MAVAGAELKKTEAFRAANDDENHAAVYMAICSGEFSYRTTNDCYYRLFKDSNELWNDIMERKTISEILFAA